MAHAPTIGIDVGGTGIKAAAVHAEHGGLVTTRRKLATPDGGMPDDIADVVATLVRQVREDLTELGETAHPTVGVCVPSVVKSGVTLSAANID